MDFVVRVQTLSSHVMLAGLCMVLLTGCPLFMPPPTASIQLDTAQGYAPLVVNFQSTSTSPSAGTLQHFWQFGDGNTSTQSNPQHSYATPGVYTVTLTVTNAFGNSNTATWSSIRVEDSGLTFFEIADDDEILAFAATDAGESVLLSRSQTNSAESAFGYSVNLGDDGSIALTLNGSGFPTSVITSDGWQVTYANYRLPYVDISVISPTGEAKLLQDAEILGEHLSLLQLFQDKSMEQAKGEVSPQRKWFSDLSVGEQMRLGLRLTRVLGCGGFTVASVFSGGAAIPLAVSTCTSLFLDLASEYLENTPFENAATTVEAAACAAAFIAGSPDAALECALSGVSIFADTFTEAVYIWDQNAQFFEAQGISPVSGARLIITPVPSQPAAGESLTVYVDTFPVSVGEPLEYYVIGNDSQFDCNYGEDYEDWDTVLTNSDGWISITVPGACSGVTDIVYVYWPSQDVLFYNSYTFWGKSMKETDSPRVRSAL